MTLAEQITVLTDDISKKLHGRGGALRGTTLAEQIALLTEIKHALDGTSRKAELIAREAAEAAEAEVATLKATLATLQTENAALKQAAEGNNADIEQVVAARITAARAEWEQTTTGNGFRERVERAAVELMAKVGQPAPAPHAASNAQTKAENKADGLARTQQAFARQNEEKQITTPTRLNDV